MEAIYKNNKVLVPIEGEGKFWCRVIHTSELSDFAKVTKRRTNNDKATLIMETEIEGDAVLQICAGGAEKPYFKLAGGTITEIKAYQLSRHLPEPIKPLEVNIKIDPRDTESIELLVKLLSQKNNNNG